MRSKYLLIFVLLLILPAADIRAKNMPKKKQKTYIKLLEASSQKILPGSPGGQVKTNYRFILIWEGDQYPETFFWRGDNGWLTCKLEKAHKIKKKDHNVPAGEDYRTDPGTAEIHKGDTLKLTPVAGGKFPIPAEIPKTAKKTLFFKTDGSRWLSFPVNKMVKKPDVATP